MNRTAFRLSVLALAVSSASLLRAQTYEVLHHFDLPGPVNPADSLIQLSDGNFYGTSVYGGPTHIPYCSLGCGTVFRMDGDGVVTTLHEFLRNEDGTIIGGYHPVGRLFVASNGDLYGTTYEGGSETCQCGTVFRIDSSGILTTVHTFEGPDGAFPQGALIEPQPGDLWGLTTAGGNLTCPDNANGCGTIFRMHLNGDLQTMHAFSGSDGSIPQGQPLLADDGNLYGTTVLGGESDAGTAFRITLNGNLTTIHDFDGLFSWASTLIQAAGGDLIGTLEFGGSDQGSVFRMTLDGAVETLHSFAADGHEGQYPHGGLLQASDGFFYGVTRRGGASDRGTIFQLGENGSFATIYDFGVNPDGASVQSAVMQAADGLLYGTTRQGGSFDRGVVYRIGLPGAPPVFFCPTGFVRRDQMAVFLLKMMHGPDYTPPPCDTDFLDVPCPGLFADWIEQLAEEGITAGCGGGNFCPLSPVTRAQMAVFLLKAKHGSAYIPPPCTPPGLFPDVPCPSQFADWIEQLAAEGITSGCGNGDFCPDSSVTRAQMAVFLLKIKHGSAYSPPPCESRFTDVLCPSGFADWIEQLYIEEITAGCAGPAFPSLPAATTEVSCADSY